MKKRDFKAFFKDVERMNKQNAGAKQRRVLENNTGKVNLPYKMFAGMQKKSLERKQTRDHSDHQARVIGDSSRNTKLMQNYFEKKHAEEQEVKKQRLDISDRGINWHQQSVAKFKDGALHVSKDAIRKMDTADLLGGTYKQLKIGHDQAVKMRSEHKQKKKLTYE